MPLVVLGMELEPLLQWQQNSPGRHLDLRNAQVIRIPRR